jgi:hypothetical protein
MDASVSWLLLNQDSSGNWSSLNDTKLRDTIVVADILEKMRITGDKYDKALSFINNDSITNSDALARKISVLSQNGDDVSDLINELLALQNPDETDATTPNYPEGGWGPTDGHASTCLDTALALEALGNSSIPKGLLVQNKTIAAGETQQFTYEYPEDTADFEILISQVSGSITFKIFPFDSVSAYSYSPITSSTYLNTTGISFTPGTRIIQISGNSASTYSFKISLSSEGYNSSVLVNPVAYLIEAQNDDGGWGLAKGSESNIYMTARVLMALDGYADSFDLETAFENGVDWIKSRQNADYGFGDENGSTVYETALAYIAMSCQDLSATQAQNALAYLISRQQDNGSWNDDAYDTAIAILALYHSMKETDRDGDGVPDISDNCPDNPNPLQTDTDGDGQGDTCDDDDDDDGLSDAYEINTLGTNPLVSDTDGDGILDGLEDMDFDGVSNIDEFSRGSDPISPDMSLTKGLNIVGYPVQVPTGYTSFDLLNDLGTEAEVSKIQWYNPSTGLYETTSYNSGVAFGSEFDILNGQGYLVYLNTDKAVSFAGTLNNSPVSLSQGLNIVSIGCIPSDYSSYDLIGDIGTGSEAASIQRLNPSTGGFETTTWYDGIPSGVQFKINNSEAYLVHMKSAAQIPALLSTPVIEITSPGDGDTLESSPIEVSGSISDNSAVVTVNGINATVAQGVFTATDVPLVSGTNTITAIATSTDNLSGSYVISVQLDEGTDYDINKGGSAGDTRYISGDAGLLSGTSTFTESITGLPTGVTYTRTGIWFESTTEIAISFTIQASSAAAEGIHEFQVEYLLYDSSDTLLTPLNNNIFEFKIKILP